MSDDSTPERLADLETRITFLDDALGALGDADVLQARRLLALEQAVHDLRTELASIRIGLGHDPHNEPPPPHY